MDSDAIALDPSAKASQTEEGSLADSGQPSRRKIPVQLKDGWLIEREITAIQLNRRLSVQLWADDSLREFNLG